jgi:hypothetical protein
MRDPRLTGVSLSEINVGSKRSVLTIVYACVECHSSRQAADPTGGHYEVKEVEHIDPEQRLLQ